MTDELSGRNGVENVKKFYVYVHRRLTDGCLLVNNKNPKVPDIPELD